MTAPSTETIYLIVMVSCVVGYLGSVRYLMNYLRASHTGVWMRLERPAMGSSFAS